MRSFFKSSSGAHLAVFAILAMVCAVIARVNYISDETIFEFAFRAEMDPAVTVLESDHQVNNSMLVLADSESVYLKAKLPPALFLNYIAKAPHLRESMVPIDVSDINLLPMPKQLSSNKFWTLKDDDAEYLHEFWIAWSQETNQMAFYFYRRW